MKAQARFEEEQDRVNKCLMPTTLVKLQKIVQHELIGNNLNTILEMEKSGLVYMLENDLIKNLELLYQLFGLVENGHSVLKRAMSNHIKNLGKAINGFDDSTALESAISPPANPNTWIEGILALKHKFENILSKCLASDPTFDVEFNSAFQHIVSVNQASAEYISVYTDSALKQLSKGVIVINGRNSNRIFH